MEIYTCLLICITCVLKLCWFISYIAATSMNKELDYQMKPIKDLYDSMDKLKLQKETVVAIQRIASTTVSFISFLATKQTKKKTINHDDIIKACEKLNIQGLVEGVKKFEADMDKNQKVTVNNNDQSDNTDEEN